MTGRVHSWLRLLDEANSSQKDDRCLHVLVGPGVESGNLLGDVRRVGEGSRGGQPSMLPSLPSPAFPKRSLDSALTDVLIVQNSTIIPLP